MIGEVARNEAYGNDDDSTEEEAWKKGLLIEKGKGEKKKRELLSAWGWFVLLKKRLCEVLAAERG